MRLAHIVTVAAVCVCSSMLGATAQGMPPDSEPGSRTVNPATQILGPGSWRIFCHCRTVRPDVQVKYNFPSPADARAFMNEFQQQAKLDVAFETLGFTCRQSWSATPSCHGVDAFIKSPPCSEYSPPDPEAPLLPYYPWYPHPPPAVDPSPQPYPPYPLAPENPDEPLESPPGLLFYLTTPGTPHPPPVDAPPDVDMPPPPPSRAIPAFPARPLSPSPITPSPPSPPPAMPMTPPANPGIPSPPPSSPPFPPFTPGFPYNPIRPSAPPSPPPSPPSFPPFTPAYPYDPVRPSTPPSPPSPQPAYPASPLAPPPRSPNPPDTPYPPVPPSPPSPPPPTPLPAMPPSFPPPGFGPYGLVNCTAQWYTGYNWTGNEYIWSTGVVDWDFSPDFWSIQDFSKMNPSPPFPLDKNIRSQIWTCIAAPSPTAPQPEFQYAQLKDNMDSLLLRLYSLTYDRNGGFVLDYNCTDVCEEVDDVLTCQSRLGFLRSMDARASSSAILFNYESFNTSMADCLGTFYTEENLVGNSFSLASGELFWTINEQLYFPIDNLSQIDVGFEANDAIRSLTFACKFRQNLNTTRGQYLNLLRTVQTREVIRMRLYSLTFDRNGGAVEDYNATMSCTTSPDDVTLCQSNYTFLRGMEARASSMVMLFNYSTFNTSSVDCTATYFTDAEFIGELYEFTTGPFIWDGIAMVNFILPNFSEVSDSLDKNIQSLTMNCTFDDSNSASAEQVARLAELVLTEQIIRMRLFTTDLREGGGQREDFRVTECMLEEGEAVVYHCTGAVPNLGEFSNQASAAAWLFNDDV
eukprot:gene16303-22490_t